MAFWQSPSPVKFMIKPPGKAMIYPSERCPSRPQLLIELCRHPLLALALLALATPALAANKYWVGASGTTNAPTSGTWQTTTPTVWSDGTVDTANATWAAGDTA